MYMYTILDLRYYIKYPATKPHSTYCIFRLGEGCSHMAAILFKVEYAVRLGYTTSTSNECRWNHFFKDRVCNKLL